MNKDNVRFILSFLGLTTVFSYGYVTFYYAGYLGVFGVDIRDVPFWPSLYDLGTLSLTVVIAAIVLTLLFFLLIIGMNYLLEKGLTPKERESKLPRWIAKVCTAGVMSKRYILSWTLIVMIFLCFKLLFVDAISRGITYAKTREQFAILLAPSIDGQDVVIYQNSGTIIIKKFNKHTRKFSSNYYVTSLEGKTYTSEKLR